MVNLVNISMLELLKALLYLSTTSESCYHGCSLVYGKAEWIYISISVSAGLMMITSESLTTL